MRKQIYLNIDIIFLVGCTHILDFLTCLKKGKKNILQKYM